MTHFIQNPYPKNIELRMKKKLKETVEALDHASCQLSSHHADGVIDGFKQAFLVSTIEPPSLS